MPALYEIKAADALLDAEFVDKWRDREAIGSLARRALGAVLDVIVATGEPVAPDMLEPALPGAAPDAIAGALDALEARDLVARQDGRVVVAYPLAARPTSFALDLPGGRERFAVCAVDALGVPAFLGQPVTIRSACHHCHEPLTLSVRPDGPAGEDQVMVWVGKREGLAARAFSSL